MKSRDFLVHFYQYFLIFLDLTQIIIFVFLNL